MHTLDALFNKSSHLMSACHLAKARKIDRALLMGTPFTALGGQRVRCREGLLRFKIGREWRLIYQLTAQGYTPCALVNRQCFERELKRRRAAKARNFHSPLERP
jgi:hypothetical protein